MHPRQASVLAQAIEVAERTAGKKQAEIKEAEDKQALSGAPAVLWKYTDPDGGVFYLEVKRTTAMKSPLTGQTFTPKPERLTPAQVGKELKEDKAEVQSKNASEVPAEFWKA